MGAENPIRVLHLGFGQPRRGDDRSTVTGSIRWLGHILDARSRFVSAGSVDHWRLEGLVTRNTGGHVTWMGFSPPARSRRTSKHLLRAQSTNGTPPAATPSFRVRPDLGLVIWVRQISSLPNEHNVAAADRAVLAGLIRLSRRRLSRFFVQPETFLCWHRDLGRRR
jgi:hypothetical protein